MAACRLCGYQIPVGIAVLSECPVCGEPCDASDGRDGANAESGQGIEHDGVKSRTTSPAGAQAWMGSDSANAFPSSCLNPELQSLLRLVPEELNRKKRAQDAVRATGGASESDVVYIRPRTDPTMRVLKVRNFAAERAAEREAFGRTVCIRSECQTVIQQLLVYSTPWLATSPAHMFKYITSISPVPVPGMMVLSEYNV